MLDTASVDDLDGELTWLAGVLGDERDREVLQARMRGLLDALPAELVLGEHQDSVVARTLLRHLAVNETQAFTYGLLYAAEHRRGQESLTAFTTIWVEDHRTGRRLLERLDRPQ